MTDQANPTPENASLEPNETTVPNADAPTPTATCTTTQNEDYSSHLPPSNDSTKPSFFSRMSSLGSSAAPILEQVYDRAHKKAVALKETNSLREAVSVVRATSAEVAKDLYPVDSGSVDDESDYSDDELIESPVANDSELEEQSQNDEKETKSPMKTVFGAYAEFRTTGRYQLKKEDDRVPLVVGGADRVPGLGRLKLNNLVSKVGTKEDDSLDDKAEPTRAYKRTNSYYEEAVKNLLQPGQRALFFGKGTMGVILKPTYLASWRGKDGGGLVSPTTKKGGVFIDALVPGGHAERSGVVFVGDHVVKIGNVDVSNMTLEEVVKAIAEAERPSIMILMAEWEPVTLKTKVLGDTDEKKYFVSPLDLAFGYVNKIATEGVEARKDMRSVLSKTSLLDNDDDNDAEEVLFSSGSPVKSLGHQLNNCDENGGNDAVLSNDQTTKVVQNGSATQQDELDKLILYSAQRTNGHCDETELQPTQSKHRSHLPALFARAAFLNANFRSTLHEAFKECCHDPRKANFLEHFFSEYITIKEAEGKAKQEREKSNGQDITEDENDATSSTNQRKLLQIYFDLVRFRNEATVCSTKQLLDSARLISRKFLEDMDRNVATIPEYVAYIAFGGTENLQSLKRALTDEDEFFEDEEHDGFHKCRVNLGVFLSMQEHFIAFLVSDDCSRMRAYLRGTSPFVSIAPSAFINTDGKNSDGSSNLLLHAILHLICMKEATGHVDTSDEYGNFIKMDTMVLNQRNGKRVAGAASMLSCPMFIMHILNQSIKQAAESLVEDEMMGTSNNSSAYKKLGNDVQILWDSFVSPNGGALSLYTISDDTQLAVEAVRVLLPSSLIDVFPSRSTVKSFTSEELCTALQNLCDELIRDYCQLIFPNFQRHIFHEWALADAAANQTSRSDANKVNEYLIHLESNGLPCGYSKKVLRQVELPRGLSSHLPGSNEHDVLTEDNSDEPVSSGLYNADVAVVFGKLADDDALPKASSDLSSDSTVVQSNVQRFACGSLQSDLVDSSVNSSVMIAADIPESFEEYMGSPPFRDRPFKGMLRKTDSNRMSIDGWEVSLTNIMIPVGRGSSDMMYSVSLIVSNIDTPPALVSPDDPQITDCAIDEVFIADGDTNQDNDAAPQCKGRSFQSPLYFAEVDGALVRKMKVPSALGNFNEELKKQLSSKDTLKQQIGVALVSRRNVIPAMRRTLSLFFDDLCSVKSNSGSHCPSTYVCKPLVDLLSVFSSQSLDVTSLKCILEPYITYASSQWIHRPLRDQTNELVEFCGMQVLESLPPVPLALLFITALLEQKIVFSSSRRSMLMAASVALKQMIQPLNWTHLLVPHAPLSMLNDLIHYPAPFILGLSTDEKQSASILRSLPSDVTLVDLDIGRVILASEFVHDDDEMDDDTKVSSQSALRSQVLVLAEFLGGIFGSATLSSWCSDSPLGIISYSSKESPSSGFSVIRNICQDFTTDLISGISSCCIWIEEASSANNSAKAIVFDEDQFIHIKKCAADNTNQLNLGQFNLVLRAFLRTQSLSTLISAGDKKMSLFS